MIHNQHHKKQNNKIPAWLYFSLHNYKGEMKTLNPLEIGSNVLFGLKKHLEEQKALGLNIELEPNNYDSIGMYGKCPCTECCNAWLHIDEGGVKNFGI